jgi:lipid A 3-O-deacylase
MASALRPLSAVLCLAASCLHADDGWDQPVFSITEENDATLSDRHYTQGINLRYLSADRASEPAWLQKLPAVGYEVMRWKWGAEVGQQMFTPEDITASRLLRFDRPYAGWLYLGGIHQRRGETRRGTPVMETWRVQVGIVGPESLAEDAQIWWHGLWDFQRPNGWDNQIETEVGLQFIYDRRYRFAVGEQDGWSLQWLPEGAVYAGNIRADVRLGSLLRAGWNIPNEFGTTATSDPGWDFGFHLFGGVQGRAVWRDIFLDGNTFRESHEVHKEPLVGEARFGGALTSRHLELSLQRVYRTKEFTRQREGDAFTSITLSVKF